MALITRFCDYFIKVHLPRLTIIFMRAAGAQHMAHPFVSGWMKEWIAFLHHRGPHLKHLCPKWMSKKFLSAYDSLRNPIGMLTETDGGDRKEILGLFWPITLSKWPVLYCPRCLFSAAFYVSLLTSIHRHSPLRVEPRNALGSLHRCPLFVMNSSNTLFLKWGPPVYNFDLLLSTLVDLTIGE